MRPSQRDQILNAAIRVVERTGVTGVTFDAVAAEAGITRGGLMYHFRSREALLEAINLHLARQWEAGLERHAGKRADEATPDERMSAFIRNSTTMASRAELLFLLEFARDPALVVPWDEIGRRWAAPPPDDPDDGMLRRERTAQRRPDAARRPGDQHRLPPRILPAQGRGRTPRLRRRRLVQREAHGDLGRGQVAGLLQHGHPELSGKIL